jgi:hypothetical protein
MNDSVLITEQNKVMNIEIPTITGRATIKSSEPGSKSNRFNQLTSSRTARSRINKQTSKIYSHSKSKGKSKFAETHRQF